MFTVAIQTVASAVAILGACFFIIYTYLLLLVVIDKVKTKRREKKLSQKFFTNIEEYRRDFSA
jgi:Flp pilus assembly protein TadB